MTEPNSTSGGATQTEQPIMVVIEHRPDIVLIDDKRRDQLFAFIEAEVEAFVPDMTTAKGRDECRALAAKVTRTKTAVDKARLQLTEDARTKIKTINESGGVIKEKLEALADKARAPLTEWETVEERRIAECKATLDMLRAAALVPMGATTESLATRIAEVEAVGLGEDHWQGILPLAQNAKTTALEALKAALERVEREETDRAELARLREEREEREAAEAELVLRNEYIDSIIEHITQCGLGFIGGQPQPYGILLRELEGKIIGEIETFGERKDEVERHRLATLDRVRETMARAQERADAEAAAEAETARQREQEGAAAAAERERAAAETAAREAEDRAREEERATAAAAAEEARLAHEAALEAERKERVRLEDEERQRVAAEQAATAERARLEADQTRRRMVKTEAKEAIMQAGITEEQAQKVVLLIIAGDIPRVILDFSARSRAETD